MRILFAIHDPSNIDRTLQFAAQFARCTDEASLALAVIEDSRRPSRSGEMLGSVRDVLGLPELKTRLRVGEPARQILAEAGESRYDLLIIGETQAQRGLSLLPQEDISRKIIDHASCPVLVVKGRARQIRRILLCDSGAENPVLSRFTRQLAELLGGEEEITVLHVMSQISAGPGVSGRQLLADEQELIAENSPEGRLFGQDLEILGQSGIHPAPKVRHGLVVDEILAEARAGDYDLVVIGAHREVGWQRYLLDDLAHKILGLMDRPVLVVR
jgi:nucleotide-binding universal stress UspA family protein